MLTNEEKINLRERALRLANELLNLPFPCLDSLRAEAEDIYRFLSKDLDDDPLKLDTPSPVWRHESEMSPEEYWRLHSKMHGIDWSRPQLVVSKHDPLLVVKVDHNFTNDCFHGTVISSGTVKWRGENKYPVGSGGTWDKSMFVYHGEIPEESTSILDPQTDAGFLQWIFARLQHVHGENPNFDYMTRLRSIIDKQKISENENTGSKEEPSDAPPEKG